MIKAENRIHHFLMSCKNTRPVYEYRKDGIYFLFGPYKDYNLNTLYIQNEEKCLEFLQNIIESDEAPYKTKWITKEVINDLKNNYYKNEKF